MNYEICKYFYFLIDRNKSLHKNEYIYNTELYTINIKLYRIEYYISNFYNLLYLCL